MLHESLKGSFSAIVWPHWKDCSQQCSKYWYLWEQFFSEPLPDVCIKLIQDSNCWLQLLKTPALLLILGFSVEWNMTEVGEPSRCENCHFVMRKWLYFQWECVFLFDGWWHRALEIQLPLEKREVGCDNSFIELFPYLTQMIMFVSKFEICCAIFTMELFQNLIKSVSVSIDCSWASPASFVVVGKGSLIACFFSLLQKFTRWANAFLQHSQDQFLITDLVRDLGDGITLLSLVEMLGRSSIF